MTNSSSIILTIFFTWLRCLLTSMKNTSTSCLRSICNTSMIASSSKKDQSWKSKGNWWRSPKDSLQKQKHPFWMKKNKSKGHRETPQSRWKTSILQITTNLTFSPTTSTSIAMSIYTAKSFMSMMRQESLLRTSRPWLIWSKIIHMERFLVSEWSCQKMKDSSSRLFSEFSRKCSRRRWLEKKLSKLFQKSIKK